ncbi:hypothetical protein O7626_31335 [Micromonospora sp. WMMD1102]|uniref:hypothetical protein n=1 Tax=Micromonospora sp. WMMD1102 TaxID=3016105 RepID=UPI0024151CB7|nr:hypothetical protein [Micromonospora sp. WMMD1102]MDG4790362.1 hypothetical protein [Micromonospora sp. WMMD1102]
MNWQIVGMVLGAGGISGFLGSLLSGLFNRPSIRADAVVKLTESAVRQVDELQERTAAAERRAAEAEQAADQARMKVRILSDEVDGLIARMRLWRAEILADPGASERLKQLVSVDPGQSSNGRAP